MKIADRNGFVILLFHFWSYLIPRRFSALLLKDGALFLGSTARPRSCFCYCCFSVGVPLSVLCTRWIQCLLSKHTKHWAAKTVSATVNIASPNCSLLNRVFTLSDSYKLASVTSFLHKNIILLISQICCSNRQPLRSMVRVPGCRTEMHCASCEVRTEFIYIM
jgi:hypothetical protein